MSDQKYFKYQFSERKDQENFFVNQTNKLAYDTTINPNFDQNIFLFGPNKSGKSHLLNIWLNANNGIIFDNNFDEIIETKRNIAIDNILEKKSEELTFHIINHCKNLNLKIYVTSSIDLSNFNYFLPDLFSRLRTFYYAEINQPDDEMCKIIMTKLFYEKQIIIKNKEIFDFIFKRIERSYNEIYLLVEKLDQLSLQKKRQLTIPLIKEII